MAQCLGKAPGTLCVLEPQIQELSTFSEAEIETHGMAPLKALAWALRMNAPIKVVRIVACEPADLGAEEDWSTVLSAPVEATVEPAAAMTESLLEELLRRNAACMSSA